MQISIENPFLTHIISQLHVREQRGHGHGHGDKSQFLNRSLQCGEFTYGELGVYCM